MIVVEQKAISRFLQQKWNEGIAVKCLDVLFKISDSCVVRILYRYRFRFRSLSTIGMLYLSFSPFLWLNN